MCMKRVTLHRRVIFLKINCERSKLLLNLDAYQELSHSKLYKRVDCRKVEEAVRKLIIVLVLKEDACV